MVIKESAVIGGRKLTIETGHLAKQASGSVVVKYGESVVLVTATGAKSAREGIDFFPLTVDYVEKTYAAGKIPGSFFRREARLSTREILVCRLIDRPIRPLFAEGYRCETQVMATVLSTDQENDPAIMSIVGASAALMVSDLPFLGPVAGVRVGRIDGEFVLNPTFSEMLVSDMDLVMAVGPKGVVMVEAGADFVPEDDFIEALMFGQEAAKPILEMQTRLAQKVGRAKREVVPPAVDTELVAAVTELADKDVAEASVIKTKMERYGRFDQIKADVVAKLEERFPGRAQELKAALDGLKRDKVRARIVDQKKRIDGRGLKDVRAISVDPGLLPRTHGSAVFTRGETQALATLTLGTTHDEQRLDLLTGEESRRFFLHYNFPPFCVGEARFLRGPSRREIGHGALAERGVQGILPDHEDFPYTIRIVSEVLESNGSSSMASVCGACLALMDGGVPIKRVVAGVAMGLIKEGRKFRILSDILGDEDHLGDMDFKVVGDDKGISALQMDIKIDGLSRDILRKSLSQAREARMFVLGEMKKALPEPRTDLSAHSPRIQTITIEPERVRDLIGPGGRNIRGIIEQTGVIIDVRDDGNVCIAASDPQAMQEAEAMVKRSTETAEVGKIYLGRVERITDFGAFVQILPGLDGLLHISELSDKRVERVEDILREQDEVLVKVVSIDRQGKVRLSRREALGKQASQ